MPDPLQDAAEDDAFRVSEGMRDENSPEESGVADAVSPVPGRGRAHAAQFRLGETGPCSALTTLDRDLFSCLRIRDMAKARM